MGLPGRENKEEEKPGEKMEQAKEALRRTPGARHPTTQQATEKEVKKVHSECHKCQSSISHETRKLLKRSPYYGGCHLQRTVNLP